MPAPNKRLLLPLPLRWSVSFAGAFALITVLLMVAIGAGLMAAMEAQSKAVISSEIERLRAAHAASGVSSLARAIEASSAEEVSLRLAASRAELDQVAPEQTSLGGGWIQSTERCGIGRAEEAVVV